MTRTYGDYGNYGDGGTYGDAYPVATRTLLESRDGSALVRMLAGIPTLLQGAGLLANMRAVEAIEFDTIRRRATNILVNAFPVIADKWGLSYAEDELDLHPADTDDIEVRRDRVVGQMLGYGPATLHLITRVAASFVGGKVRVIENYPTFNVIIQFVSTVSSPVNQADFLVAMRRIVPMHLSITLAQLFNTWTQWDSYGKTWTATDALNLTWDQHDVYQGP